MTTQSPKAVIVVIDNLTRALVAAERLIAGFEGDEMQDGIDALLAQIRAALYSPAPDLVKASEGFKCTACGRAELDCSRAPCAAVLADREA